MTRNLAIAALALLLGSPTTAHAQTPPELTNDFIDFSYRPPTSEIYKPIYERMKQRQILERLAAFLSPINLKGGLALSLEEGGKSCVYPNSYYDGRGTLHLCYSWFYMLENQASHEVVRSPGTPFTAKTPGLMPGITRPEVIIGGTVQVIMHELGHALFDIQEIPLFGREEDGADQIAALVMLQFGKDVALTTIKGTYNVWHHLNARNLLLTGGKVRPGQEADEHSISIQRAYNFLCMAYGKDPAAFEELADLWLPRIRKSSCDSEYKQAALAFKKTVLPDLDEPKMKRVLQMDVLRPEDFRFD
jgi:Putative metallopeptidase